MVEYHFKIILLYFLALLFEKSFVFAMILNNLLCTAQIIEKIGKTLPNNQEIGKPSPYIFFSWLMDGF